MAKSFGDYSFGKKLTEIKRFGKDDGSYKIMEVSVDESAIYIVISIGKKGAERTRGVFKLGINEALELEKVLHEATTYLVRNKMR